MFTLLTCAACDSADEKEPNELEKDLASTEVQKTVDRKDETETNDTIQLMPDPITWKEITELPRFTANSTISSGKEVAGFCDDTEHGFYGKYYMMDPTDRSFTAGIFGHTWVYKTGKPGDWMLNDPDQKIWKIELFGDKFALWNQLRVGMNRSDFLKVVEKLGGIPIVETALKSKFKFSNYLVEVRYENDQVTGLILTRQCLTG